MATPTELVGQITAYSQNMAAAVGHLEEALRDAREEAKRLPALTKQVADAEAKLAALHQELATLAGQVEKAHAAKQKVLRELAGA